MKPRTIKKSLPSLPEWRYLLFSLWAISCLQLTACKGQDISITHNHPMVQYMGRTLQQNNATLLYWPGSSATIAFQGTTLHATLQDEKGDNYYYVVIDGIPGAKLHLDTTKKEYTLAEKLPKARHTVQLFKLTEATMGYTRMFGFRCQGTLLQTKAPTRNIEFYGNSITAGYSVDDTTSDSGSPAYFNNYYSYAAITARHFGAGYRCMAKSGIGLLISWFPVTMPQIYDRVNPEDSTIKFQFHLTQPDIVVVNLFQNDSWLIHKPQHPQFKARFGAQAPDSTQIIATYTAFISRIRQHYPKAVIVCALGSMDATKLGSPWPGYIQHAAANLLDAKVYTHFFEYKNTAGHPKRKDQQAMADSLIAFIEKNIPL